MSSKYFTFKIYMAKNMAKIYFYENLFIYFMFQLLSQ